MLTSMQKRQIELDRRVICSKLRTQHHDAVKVAVMTWSSQQVADVMLQADQDRRGVNRPWAK